MTMRVLLTDICIFNTKFANLCPDYAKVVGKSAKYFGKCKQSSLLPNVKKCKLVKTSKVYKKYSYYNLK